MRDSPRCRSSRSRMRNVRRFPMRISSPRCTTACRPSCSRPPIIRAAAISHFSAASRRRRGSSARSRSPAPSACPSKSPPRWTRSTKFTTAKRWSRCSTGGGVEFIGEIDERAKSEFLGEAQALLFPIDWPEPFGLVMIEAMACGTPVLAFRKGSVPEIIEEGLTGRIVSSIDEAMLALPEVIALDRRAVRRRFEERFSATRMAKDYVNVYRRLLKQSIVMDAPSLAPSISPALPTIMSPSPEASTLRGAGRYAD